ncbi:MAG: hypothetical protein KGV59_07440 [Tenacibaculum sp.]|nr:hypothetical protein [Tenacibaculum sp.]
MELVTLNCEIMDAFQSNDELAVITGGKGILDKIKDIVDDINLLCSNGNCGCPA